MLSDKITNLNLLYSQLFFYKLNKWKKAVFNDKSNRVLVYQNTIRFVYQDVPAVANSLYVTMVHGTGKYN